MNKNKFEQIIKIVEDYFKGSKTTVWTKVISGGYQIQVNYPPIGFVAGVKSFINCYNTGTVTYQGAELSTELAQKLRQVTTGGWLASEDTSEGLVSVHSLSEILSMWEHLRKSLFSIATPNLRKQISEIPEVRFDG